MQKDKQKCSKDIKLVGIIIITLIGLGLVLWFTLFWRHPGSGKAERYFQNHCEEILLLKEFLEQSEYAEIYIHDDSGTMSSGTKHIQIADTTVCAALTKLMADNIVIMKDEKGIFFQIWTWSMDSGYGIAYITGGTDISDNRVLYKFEPLAEENWYYYYERYVKE